MNKDSGLNLLAGTIIFSIALHAALLMLKIKTPADSGYEQGITLTLAPHRSDNSNSDSRPPIQQKDTHINEDASQDIRDDALPWKENVSNAFGNIKSNSQSRPDLDWIEQMFTSDTPIQGNQVVNQPNTEAIKDLLKASPSTRSQFWAYLVKHLANNKYHDKQYPFSGLKDQRIVVLELGFQSSGMLVKAEIARSSGDSNLDAAAIRSAYAANPFNAPPTADRDFGFNYLVQIIYTPRKEN